MRKWWVFLFASVLALGAWAQVRTGAWVDEVVFIMEPDRAKGVNMLLTGAIDLYWWDLAEPDLVRSIVENVNYARLAGVAYELTFNPCGPEFKDGRFNPFCVPAIREAVNWLVDREYIVAEFFGGLTAIPRWFAIHPLFPDYARHIGIARALELKYSPNFEKAASIIAEEMEKLGAELIDGKWYYKGAPVVLKFLIRNEDRRKEIGDYVATLFEKLGFETERMYKTGREASPLWMTVDPCEGTFHVYTGGWVATVIDRDQADIFDYYYTPRGRPDPLWQAYKPEPRFDEVADRLARADFTTFEERGALIAEALELSLKDSVRVWLVNTLSYQGYAKNVSIAADLAGGISGSYLWALTIGFVDPDTGQRIPGGTLRTASSNVFVDPWNPIAGSNWIFDMTPIRATADWGVIPDPYTGLFLPQRIERAEVYIKEGLPVIKSLDWVNLHFVPEIEVPEDAWADWDAAQQRFITVAERFPQGVKAVRKSVVYYPKNLWDIQLHDGSKLSLADFVLGIILTFDRAKPESPIYDEAAVPSFRSFMQYFRGVRIVSEDPLVIETYSDLWYPDAEWNVSTWFPYYSQGPGFWHTLALGIKAESAKELAFSSTKAIKLGVERMNYIAGPSLAILAKHLEEAIATNYIPYAPTLEKYVTPDEVAVRYANLKAWYEKFGHFWVASGPLYVAEVKPVEKILVLRRFEMYPDRADKWLVFAEPKIPDVEVMAPAPVLRRGAPWDFLVNVTYKDQPYPVAEIDFVTYLLFDAEGNLVLSGRAEPVKDGLFLISISADKTSGLPTGEIRIEVAVASKVVALPSLTKATFTAL